MKRFLWAVLILTVAVFAAYVLFAVFLFVRAMFLEDFKALVFPKVLVHATVKMHPLYISSFISSRDDLTPIYISVKGKCLKLDSGTTRDETKNFFDGTGLGYKERVEKDFIGDEHFLIFSGCFVLHYHRDKLESYHIYLDRHENYFRYRGRDDIKMIDGVSIGTSRRTLFPLPLQLADIEAMFGRKYEISNLGRFI